MPDALGVCGTTCKVKKEENLFFGDSQLPSEIARTRVRLLYSVSKYEICLVTDCPGITNVQTQTLFIYVIAQKKEFCNRC